MKKILLTLSLSVFPILAFGHELSALKRPTHTALNDFGLFAKSLKKVHGIVVDSFTIEKIAPLRKNETKSASIERVIKYFLHKNYPITGDDGGYSFSFYTKGTTARDIEKAAMNVSWLFDVEEIDSAKLKTLLLKATEKGLYVYIGNGGGNNTHADIVVVADPATMEFVSLLSSNFGSDD